MLGEVAKLIVQLDLGGNLKSGIAGVEKQLAGLNTSTKTVSGGFKTLGAGFLVAGIRATALLAAQTGAVAGAVGAMVKEGQDAARVQTIYAKAIANSGKVSTQYVDILNAQQKSLMNLGGVDDELIKTEQTRLIQMGLTGAQVAKLTPLILDMSKATGRDLLTSTLAVGKAVSGNVAGLQRYGVFVDKTKAKTDAFGAVQDALNKKFGGTTQALSGSLENKINVFWENLKNVREEAGQRLAPALIRIVDIAGTKLVPAFGKFIDRAMPSIIDQINKFADALDHGGAERGIKAITDALGPMVDMLKIAAAPVKLIVDAFLKLPSQVQGLLIGGLALNKLSSGLIGQGVGQIAQGSIQAVLPGILGKLGLARGATPATPMYVADVTGGGIAGVAAGGKWANIGKIIGGAFAIVAVAELADAIHSTITGTLEDRTKTGKLLPTDQLSWPWGPKNTPHLDFGPLKNILGGDSTFTSGALTGDLGRRGPMPLTAIQVANAVAVGTERGIVHSGIFKSAQAVRDAAGFRLSRDALIASIHGKGPLGQNDLISAEAIALASGNKLRNDPNTANLRSAANNLSLLKRAQDRMPADLAAQLQPKIHSLEVAINNAKIAITNAIKNKQFVVNAYTGTNQKPGVHHAPGTGPLIGEDKTRASGGPVEPGEEYLVGEHGPEIFRTHKRGTIIPNHALRHRATSALDAWRSTSALFNKLRANAIWQEINAPVFNPNAKLDASQIIDRRGQAYTPRVDLHRRQFTINNHINANVSTRDVNTSQNVKRRYGPTYTQAGAG